jgi:succinate dehydrogenase / fumarate reductase iron-sulfur subunit
MVEFALPKNSRITGGKDLAEAGGRDRDARSSRSIAGIRTTARIPSVDTYLIDTQDCGPMVLDGLIWIKNHIDPTLTFRRSCREGVCGSCAMNIDGQNTLACTKSMHDVEGRRGEGQSAAAPAGGEGPGAGPDQFLRAIRLDRAVAEDHHADAAEGMEAEPRGPRKARRPLRVHPVRLLLDLVPELLVEQRPLPRARALLQATRWVKDSRDEATGERLDNLEDPFRLYRCHTIMNCAKACPKGLNPPRRSPSSS